MQNKVFPYDGCNCHTLEINSSVMSKQIIRNIIVHVTNEKINFLKQAHFYTAVVLCCGLWFAGNK
jgi:ABC-type polysaccharide transport system permease subunit